MLDRLGDVPMAVFTATARHPAVEPAVGGAERRSLGLVGLERNLVWRHFTHGHDGVEFDEQHEEEFSERPRRGPPRSRRAATRATAGSPTSSRGCGRESPEFERRWAEAQVAEHRSSRKTVTHTPVGPITIDCDVLTAPGGDLRIVVYTAARAPRTRRNSTCSGSPGCRRSARPGR